MKPLFLTATVVAALVIGACDKSDSGKTEEAASTAANKPAGETAKTPAPATATRPGADEGTKAPAKAAAAADEGTKAPAKAAPEAATSPQPSPSAATAGLDLAAASAGVLTKDLNLAPAAGPPRSTAGDDGRHPTCVKLLACTHDAVVLAPDSVTSYSVTLESVDSLEASDAAAECASDLKDVVVILKHGKHAVPKSCL